MRSLVALCLLVVIGGCHGSGSGSPAPSPTPTSATSGPSPAHAPTDPEIAVEKLMRALDDGDCAAVKHVVVTPSEVDCGLVTEAAGSFAAEGIDLDQVRYRATKPEDDSVTVEITWGNDYPTESYDVQRIDGDWRVVFDSAA
jgi:hypothetical protein